MQKKLMIMFIFLTVLVSSEPLVVKANDSIGFSYENIIPKNQVKETTGNYFDLTVKPGDVQEVKTSIKNRTKKNQKIKISINDATTTSSGKINYGDSKVDLSNKAESKLTDVMEGPTQIELKPEETKIITFKLTMPKKAFEGYLLGGVHLKEVKQEEDNLTQTSTGIKNEYAYVYSVRLRTGNKEVKPDFKGLPVKYEDKQLFVSFQNETPLMVKGMGIEMIATRKGSDKVLAEKKVKNYQMAPYSPIIIPFDKPIEVSGGDTYRTVTKITLGEKKWQFEDEIKIEEKTKKATNTLDTSRTKKVNGSFLIILGSVFVGSVAVVYVVLIKLNKKKNRGNKKRK